MIIWFLLAALLPITGMVAVVEIDRYREEGIRTIERGGVALGT